MESELSLEASKDIEPSGKKNIDIICTLGTTTDNPKILEDMIKYGMNCARLNTAYATIEDYDARIDLVREAGAKMGKHIDIMMDIKGPQVRLVSDCDYPIDEDAVLKVGFGKEPIHFNKDFYGDIIVGDIICMENGTIQTMVSAKNDEKKLVDLVVMEIGEGKIHKCMGVNVPGKHLNIPVVSRKDVKIIEYSVAKGVEYIALSFARSYKDIEALRGAINYYSKIRNIPSEKKPGIIIKPEEQLGIANLEDMIEAAKKDGFELRVMIPRGDLYVEMPYYDLPFIQEKMIQVCKEKGTYVMTATGILESMQYNNMPTRAEVCDVYNALRAGTDGLMLSGETSNCKENGRADRTVKVLSEIIGNYQRHTPATLR